MGKLVRHNPRCAIFDEPPSLREAGDCNCGAIPPLPKKRPCLPPKSKSFQPTSQAELSAAANYIVMEFRESVDTDDLQVILDAIQSSPPITSEMKDAYIAYDGGFGYLSRKE